MALKEDKALIIYGFNNESNISNLILEVEDKKQYIGNLEEKLKFAKYKFKTLLASYK